MTLSAQNLTTADHKTVCARTQVVMTIVDPMLAFVETSSLEEVVVDMAMSGVKAVIAKKNFADLVSCSRAVDAAISRRVRADLKTYGVNVVRCFLSDFSIARVICLTQD
jgi:regulator of protease activity HflC (stomatin/prohibitin superfamily)